MISHSVITISLSALSLLITKEPDKRAIESPKEQIPVTVHENPPAISTVACTAPNEQPTEASAPIATDNSIKLSFTAVTDGAMNIAYLILRHTDPEPAEEPADGTTYAADEAGFSNATVVHYGPETEFTIQNLESDIAYFFTVYAANTAGADSPCYNRTNPLRMQAKTNEAVATKNPDKTVATSKLSTLLNFNFAGEQNGWTNLTPVIFYGWTKTGKNNFRLKKDTTKKPIGLFKNAFQMGPYIGSVTSLKDSTSYLPSLMLPGNGGLQINYFMTLFNDAKFNIKIAPLNFGLKVISGFSDTTLSVVQHNLRTSFAIEFADYFNASVQFSRGWHNLTSKSEDNFAKIFEAEESKITYWNVNLTTRLSPDLFAKDKGSSPLFLSISWHSLARTSQYGGLPNSKFITIGLLTDLSVTNGSHPGHVPKAPNF